MSCLIFAERRWPSGIPAVMRVLESGCNCTRTPENMVSEPLSPWASSVTPETLSAGDGCTTGCAFAVAKVVVDSCPSVECAAALVRVFTVARAADDGCTAAGVGCACSTFRVAWAAGGCPAGGDGGTMGGGGSFRWVCRAWIARPCRRTSSNRATSKGSLLVEVWLVSPDCWGRRGSTLSGTGKALMIWGFGGWLTGSSSVKADLAFWVRRRERLGRVDRLGGGGDCLRRRGIWNNEWQ